MANEILLASQATQTDMISRLISRAFVESVVLLPHIATEELPVGTKVKLFRKDDELGVSATVTEASNYSYGSDSDYAQTTVSLTMGKTVIASKITVEAQQFGGANDADLIARQGRAIARTLDAAIKPLMDGFSQVVTCVGTTTPNDLLQAWYLIDAGNAGRQGNLVGIVSPKAAYELRSYALNAAAPSFTNTPTISLLSGVRGDNGYVGSIPGVDIYSTGGLSTATIYTKGGVYNPDLAICGCYGPVEVARTGANSQGLYTEIASYCFNQVAEWNDLAGVEIDSIT
jgi:hypothetical protein